MSETCACCGLIYDDLRTGLSYRDVFIMLWVGNDDPRTWRYKRRHTVLGLWHQIKLELWHHHLEVCDAGYDHSPNGVHEDDVGGVPVPPFRPLRGCGTTEQQRGEGR